MHLSWNHHLPSVFVYRTMILMVLFFMIGSSPTGFSLITGCDPDGSTVFCRTVTCWTWLVYILFTWPLLYIPFFISKFSCLIVIFIVLCFCYLIISSFLSSLLPISPSYFSVFLQDTMTSLELSISCVFCTVMYCHTFFYCCFA